MGEEEPEPVVPEVTPQELMAELQSGQAPLILDIREPFERQQVHIPHTLHIPMNRVPSQLHELDKVPDIVVLCAHGNRSYGVTAWLQERGYPARNLKGGITLWRIQGGGVDVNRDS